MTLAHSGNGLDGKTCLCCMCRCGDHKCFQQLVSELPASMQIDLKPKELDTYKKSDRPSKVPQADMYRKSTYTRDFCEPQELIDRFPLEHQKLETHLRLHTGDVAGDSTYSNDYIPFSRRDQDMCRAKLHVPDYMLEGIPAEEPSQKIPFGVYNYYCPPHCIGAGRDETKENCLMNYKDKFNIGPPVRVERPAPEKPREPFEKFTNYRLDYRGGPISPRPVRKHGLKVEKLPIPMESETSYRSAFSCPPDNAFSPNPYEAPERATDKRSTLKVGDGPMQQDSTAMLDYQDPDVEAHKPWRPPREVYKPPHLRMETATTTGCAFPRWKVLPNQVKPQKFVETDYSKEQRDEVRRQVTTYQEDFDGLRSALCPCRTVENYGPKYLEPRYRYAESQREHDFFRYDTKFSEPKNEYCPH